MRGPNSLEAGATSRNDAIATELNQNRPNAQSRVYRLLTMEKDYYKISNNRASGDSLEAIHDTIHNLVGNGGHMYHQPYAAFDPIFWLHHA